MKLKHFMLCKLWLVLTTQGQVLLPPKQMLVGVTSDCSVSSLGVCKGLLVLWIYRYWAEAASRSELFHWVPVSTCFYFHIPGVCVFLLAVLVRPSYPTTYSKIIWYFMCFWHQILLKQSRLHVKLHKPSLIQWRDFTIHFSWEIKWCYSGV